MARKVRNHPIPRDGMQERKGAEEGTIQKRQMFSVALYIRLSKEDSGRQNQNTVENQVALLKEFVKNKADMKVFEIYVDNGYSGTNFERPAFRRMMEDAKCGKINCIIVKDLSRLGRSYLETGNYLEKIFPFWKIRFISVTDHFDSFMTNSLEKEKMLSNEIEIPLKNIINEVYAKDISRKVSSVIEIKKQEGRHGGGLAPYGYQKSKTVKGRYEIDEEAAEVVRYIFRLRSKGYGYCSIVRILNEKGIKSPSAYRYEKGIVKKEQMQQVIWKTYAIENMLRDEVYLGNMVRGKTHSAMYRGEKRHRVPRTEWRIVKGMHEPVISQELFDAVQAVNEKHSKEHLDKRQKGKEHPKRENQFRGKIFCGDCGAAMGYTCSNKSAMSYYCVNYRENGTMGCVKKYISARKLEKTVLEVVQIYLKMFLERKDTITSWNKGKEMVDLSVKQGRVTRAIVDCLIERIEVFAKGRIHIVFRYEDQFQKMIEKSNAFKQEGAG